MGGNCNRRNTESENRPQTQHLRMHVFCRTPTVEGQNGSELMIVIVRNFAVEVCGWKEGKQGSPIPNAQKCQSHFSLSAWSPVTSRYSESCPKEPASPSLIDTLCCPSDPPPDGLIHQTLSFGMTCPERPASPLPEEIRRSVWGH